MVQKSRALKLRTLSFCFSFVSLLSFSFVSLFHFPKIAVLKFNSPKKEKEEKKMGNGLQKERSKKRAGKERSSSLRIAFQGPGGVGKSSLVCRYVQVLFFFFCFFFFFESILKDYLLFLFLRVFLWRNMIL